MRKVAVIGCGYVGSGMISMLSAHYQIVRYDPPRLLHDKKAVNECELAIICVPTPVGDGGACDVSIVEEVASWCRCRLVLIKSTVAPGTTDRLQRVYGSAEQAFHFSPEYMGEPRNAVAPWKHPDPRNPAIHDFMIVGGPLATEVLDFFTPVMRSDARFRMCTAIEAELTKYMENSYFAVKVAFVHQWAAIARAHRVDYKTLRELWLLDPRVEADHTQVFPGGAGYGGKCLPKDMLAIIRSSLEYGLDTGLLSAVHAINEEAIHASRQRDDRVDGDGAVSGSDDHAGSSRDQAPQGTNGQGRPHGYHETSYARDR